MSSCVSLIKIAYLPKIYGQRTATYSQPTFPLFNFFSTPSSTQSGVDAPAVTPTVVTPSSHSGLDLIGHFDVVRGFAFLLAHGDQPARIGAVAAAHHQHHVNLAGKNARRVLTFLC